MNQDKQDCKGCAVQQGYKPAEAVHRIGEPQGKWLTVVYRDIKPGDEERAIGENPKVSALSWSHALDDRDAKHARIAELEVALKSARSRLVDMLEGDDGQAWKEARKALPRIDAAIAGNAIKDYQEASSGIWSKESGA